LLWGFRRGAAGRADALREARSGAGGVEGAAGLFSGRDFPPARSEAPMGRFGGKSYTLAPLGGEDSPVGTEKPQYLSRLSRAGGEDNSLAG